MIIVQLHNNTATVVTMVFTIVIHGFQQRLGRLSTLVNQIYVFAKTGHHQANARSLMALKFVILATQATNYFKKLVFLLISKNSATKLTRLILFTLWMVQDQLVSTSLCKSLTS